MRARLHLRPLLALAVAGIIAVAVVLATLSTPHPARASSTTTANPWTMQMTDGTQDGLVVRGTTGTSNPFIVFDRLGQPIAAIGEAGGFKVFGDDSGVYAGSDIFHAQVTTSALNPNSAVCVRNGQLWIGGPDGHIWRCANLGGGYGWWVVS